MNDDNRTDLQRAEQDNRNEIMARNEADNAYKTAHIDEMRLLIVLQENRIKQLEQTIAQMTTVALALQGPERLKSETEAYELREVKPDGTTKPIDWEEFNEWIAGGSDV